MKNVFLFLIIFSSISKSYSQDLNQDSNKVRRYFYQNGNVSFEKWYGNDKKLDSFKTFHKTGKIDEQFYYLNGRPHGKSYKHDRFGKKITTWEFDNGKLVERIDHILEFNKKNEDIVKEFHIQLKELNANLKAKPNDTKSRLHRAHIRYMLGNRVLALSDLNWQTYYLKKVSDRRNVKPSGKILANIYDRKASIYARFEMKNYASHYRYKAVEANPEKNTYVFNLGAYFYTIKSYDLAKYYLNKSLDFSPNHAFTHRVLAALHTDFGDYEQAKYHIDIAFPKEYNLIKYGHGSLENDIRTQRGYISHKLGDSENGIKDLKEALELNENNSIAHRHLGTIYYDLGEYTLACKHLQKAKTLDYEVIYDKDDLQAYLELSCEKSVIAETGTNTQVEVAIEMKPNTVATLADKPFIYPNPTKGEIHIKNLLFKDYQYLIFDHTGKLVFEGESRKTPINIAHLSTGIYILKAVKNDKSETFRVLKD